jgi:20S proteasome subunit alpha 3
MFLISVEVATLSREDGKTKIRILPASELDVYIQKYNEEEAKIEAEKKKAEKAAASSSS